MNATPAPISELICTRISHDLIGNIGAVANAVELLEEGDMDFIDDIRSILKTSSQVLSARLKFFRLAFGLNNTSLEDKSFVVKTIGDYLKTIGNQSFPVELDVADYTPAYAGVIMVSAMILADIVIKGGKISIFESNNKLYINVSTVSKLSEQKINVVKALLSGQEVEYLAQFAPVFYLRELVKASDLHISQSDERTFGFVFG